MARDRVTRTYPEGYITNPNYSPRTSGRVVARDFMRVIDYAIDRLVEADDDGGKKTDVNFRYQTAAGETIERRSSAQRASIFSGNARVLDDDVTLKGISADGRFSKVLLRRTSVEQRTRRSGQRPLVTVSNAAYFYHPGDFNINSKFEYNAAPGNHEAHVVPDAYHTLGAGLKLYGDGQSKDLAIGKIGLDYEAARSMALTLNAAALACSQNLLLVGSRQVHPGREGLVDDPYDYGVGILGRFADLILSR